MKHYNHIDEVRKESIFFKKPMNLSLNDEREKIAYGLGATLYMPATRKSIAEDIISKKYPELMSMVVCTEDAIGDSQREVAIKNLIKVFEKLRMAVEDKIIQIDEIPFVFIRVKDTLILETLVNKGVNLKYLTGFVFPKINSTNISKYFEILKDTNARLGLNLYGMPILESHEIIYKDTRFHEMQKIKNILDEYKDLVLNIRIGATDFSNLFSVRRSYHQTIYDIIVIRDCITDIINFMLRSDSDYVVSGPVWEYFSNEKGYNYYEDYYGEDKYIQGLVKETILDNVNGLVGKTVIHPNHIRIVNALQCVNKEEYDDAVTVIENYQNGVIKSMHNNKMNEPKPHIRWARKIIKKSNVFGVLNEGYDYRNLFR
jgi:citrate lyase beta subunit